jgi:RNA polymerase sigma-70 factor (ECF subfamily)
VSEDPLPQGSHDTPHATSVHVQRAVGGDGDSLSWLVGRFTPLLLAQARYRLGERLRTVLDPDDLVNDVWMRALPHLAGLTPRDGRLTPVLLKFLSTTLLHRVKDLFEKHVQGKPTAAVADGTQADPVAKLALDRSGAVTLAIRGERHRLVHEAIAALSPRDREVLILRGIEQRTNQEVADILDLEENAASARYHRALEHLRQTLPKSVFGELVDA